ncbi:MAG: alpha/beta hydrolase [Burkholderiales bacterium]|nr:alpha/beta hydrolase [Burkholderiales bacterium]
MTARLSVLLFALCVLLGSTPASAANPAMRTVQACGAPVPLQFDIMRAAGEQARFPALVLVHGGGWFTGSRADFHGFMQELARRGIASMSVDYRLVPQATFPAQIEDVKCAMRWLHAHAAEYQIDPQRIAAMGASAGAQLVALAGATPGKWDRYGGYTQYSSVPRCMILHGTPSDLSDWWATADVSDHQPFSTRNMLKALMQGDFPQMRAAYRAASPVSYAQKKIPPTLLIHGEQDDIVPVHQSTNFAAKLRAAGAPVQLITIPDGDHMGFGSQGKQVTQQFFQFLDQCLR